MTKSTQNFEILEGNKEKIFFYFFFLIFEYLMKNTKMTQNMKILDQDTRCMQECYECQNEHQEHFEDHDEHQELFF